MTTRIIGVILACIALSVILITIVQNIRTTAAADPSIVVLSPTAEVTRGELKLEFSVDGLSSDEYEPFWAVGQTAWNRLTIKDDTAQEVIDLSKWNWRKDGAYTIRFIALKKSDWQPIETSVTFTIKDAEAVQAVENNPIPSPVTALPVIRIPEAVVTTPKPTTRQLYTDTDSSVAKQAAAWSQSHPEDAAKITSIASQPMARWFGGWNSDIESDVSRYVTKAAAANSVPVLVTYNIPKRDCGSYSAGGLNSTNEYLSWIEEVARGIGNNEAIVIVEPDAISYSTCLSPSEYDSRIGALKRSVEILKQAGNTRVYLDAGNPRWLSASDVANRLTAAGVSQANGFSLNVSNFISTEENITYGEKISQLTNNARYVIDTSRNGNGPTKDLAWCNPAGRKIGRTPTLTTNVSSIDAFLWIKSPGESDGTCGPSVQGTTAPSAGQFWPQYLVSLAQ